MAKPDDKTAELEKLRAERETLIVFVRYIRDWARFNDHGIKCKAVAALSAAGEKE